MKKQIIVNNCHECPYSKRHCIGCSHGHTKDIRVDDICHHPDSIRMSVRHNDETIHHMCPLSNCEEG